MDENTEKTVNTEPHTPAPESERERKQDSGEITRSIRANKEDFNQLNEIAASLGVKQGGAFRQLLSFWSLNHVSDEMREQAAQVEQVQELLGRIGDLFTAQFGAIKTTAESAKRAASAEMEKMRVDLKEAQDEIEHLKEACATAVAAQKNAEEEARAAVASAKEADDRARDAEVARDKSAKEAAESLSALSATREAIDDAKASAVAAQAARQTAETALADVRHKLEEAKAAKAKADAETKRNVMAFNMTKQSLDKTEKALAKATEDANAARTDALNRIAQMQERADARVEKAEERLKAEYGTKLKEKIAELTKDANAAIAKANAELADYKKAHPEKPAHPAKAQQVQQPGKPSNSSNSSKPAPAGDAPKQ